MMGGSGSSATSLARGLANTANQLSLGLDDTMPPSNPPHTPPIAAPAWNLRAHKRELATGGALLGAMLLLVSLLDESPTVLIQEPACGQASYQVIGTEPIAGVEQFAGIRYGTAGRWQKPKPAPCRAEPLQATEFGEMCAQASGVDVGTSSGGLVLLALCFFFVAMTIWGLFLPGPKPRRWRFCEDNHKHCTLAWKLWKSGIRNCGRRAMQKVSCCCVVLSFVIPANCTPAPSEPELVASAGPKPPNARRCQNRCACCGVSWFLLLAVCSICLIAVNHPGHEGSEDCLFLNVWRQSGLQTTDQLYPVFVFFHGGDLTTGSGNMAGVLPLDWAKNEKVILVSINYVSSHICASREVLDPLP